MATLIDYNSFRSTRLFLYNGSKCKLLMNTSVENIRNKYKLIESIDLEHDIAPFIHKHLFTWNLITISYLILFLAITLGWAIAIIINMGQYTSVGNFIIRLSIGIFLLPLIIIPIHEAIHGLVYKVLGAKQVRYTADFRRFIFTAQANKFVVNSNEFYWLAFAPFLLITLAGLVTTSFFPMYRDIIFAFVFIHTTMCAGDFGLASYFFKHRNKRLVTYDNFEDNRAYFFGKVSY